jgi:hypothetical protein
MFCACAHIRTLPLLPLASSSVACHLFFPPRSRQVCLSKAFGQCPLPRILLVPPLRQRAIEVTLASSRLGASIVSKSGSAHSGRRTGGASAPRLAFRRVDAAEYASASMSGNRERDNDRAREIARKWDRYAADEDGAHLC